MSPLEQRVQNIEGILNRLLKSDRMILSRTLQINDGRNIQVGVSTGTKIGTASTQKLSVYGATPVVRANAISAPSGGATQDAEARTAINSIRTAIKNFGITA